MARPPRDAWAALPTEQVRGKARALEALPLARVVAELAGRERDSVAAVTRAAPVIAKVAAAAASAFVARGRLIYVGAGSSGRLGALDAAECPPTFGVPRGLVRAILAGGRAALDRAVEGAEDDAAAGAHAIVRDKVGARDVVVGIAASGGTPFVVAALAAARAAGAKTALVTCAGAAARKAGVRVDHLVALDVGAEVIAGSTRLGAGTATKIALNAITTAAMIASGRTWGPYMVDVVATNAKLRARARRLVMQLGDVGEAQADSVLAEANGRVKVALMMVHLGLSAHLAEQMLASAGGRLHALLGPPRAPRAPRRRP